MQFWLRPSITAIKPPFRFADGTSGNYIEGLRLASSTIIGYTSAIDRGTRNELDIARNLIDDNYLYVPSIEYANVSTANDVG